MANDAKSATSDLEELISVHSNITSRTNRAESNSILLQTNINEVKMTVCCKLFGSQTTQLSDTDKFVDMSGSFFM